MASERIDNVWIGLQTAAGWYAVRLFAPELRGDPHCTGHYEWVLDRASAARDGDRARLSLRLRRRDVDSRTGKAQVTRYEATCSVAADGPPSCSHGEAR